MTTDHPFEPFRSWYFGYAPDCRDASGRTYPTPATRKAFREPTPSDTYAYPVFYYPCSWGVFASRVTTTPIQMDDARSQDVVAHQGMIHVELFAIDTTCYTGFVYKGWMSLATPQTIEDWTTSEWAVVERAHASLNEPLNPHWWLYAAARYYRDRPGRPRVLDNAIATILFP